MPTEGLALQRRSGLRYFVARVANLTILHLRLWHALAIAMLIALLLFNVDALDQLSVVFKEAVLPLVPYVSLVTQLLAFMVIATVWTLRKMLDEQMTELSGRVTQLVDATGALTNTTDASTVALKKAARSIVSNSQTAANGLSESSNLAASDIAKAADVITKSADTVTSASTQLSEEAERARLKLEQQSDRLRDELARLTEDFETKIDRTIKRLKDGNDAGASVADSQSPGRSDEEEWENVRSTWKEARDDVSRVIENIFDTVDGRTTRHFKFDYRRYSDIADQLAENHFITENAKNAIKAMDYRFAQLRRRARPVTQSDVDLFKDNLQKFRIEAAARLPPG